MGFFNRVKSSYKMENFSLIDFYETSGNSTPEPEVPMKDFDQDGLSSAILINICKQKYPIEEETLEYLVSFLQQRPENSTQRIYLEILVHFSKMNVDLCKNEYEDSASYYNKALRNYVRVANLPENVDKAEIAPEELIDFCHRMLKTGPILEAIQRSLELVREKSKIENRFQEINSIRFYVMDQFPPLPGLRGACLPDGLLLCTDFIKNWQTEPKGKAALVCLLAHEVTHFLASMAFQDFNFSTTSKYLGREEQKRTDPVIESRPLELGRNTELLLFDGVQPCWVQSSVEAATIFLMRLEEGCTLPVLKVNEEYLLINRLPSLPMGLNLDKCISIC